MNKDLKLKKKSALLSIFQDYERYKGYGTAFDNFFKEFQSKLNKEDYDRLNIQYSMLFDYIINIFANTPRVRVQFDKQFDDDKLFEYID